MDKLSLCSDATAPPGCYAGTSITRIASVTLPPGSAWIRVLGGDINRDTVEFYASTQDVRVTIDPSQSVTTGGFSAQNGPLVIGATGEPIRFNAKDYRELPGKEWYAVSSGGATLNILTIEVPPGLTKEQPYGTSKIGDGSGQRDICRNRAIRRIKGRLDAMVGTGSLYINRNRNSS